MARQSRGCNAVMKKRINEGNQRRDSRFSTLSSRANPLVTVSNPEESIRPRITCDRIFYAPDHIHQLQINNAPSQMLGVVRN